MVESTAALTKSLRDKSKLLLDLLPVAQAVYKNDIFVFFPGKEEWLLEWLVERLQNEESPAARLSSQSWQLLYELLSTPDLNVAAASATLRKHKFVDILAKTLSGAIITSTNDNTNVLDSRNGSEDVEMHDAHSSASSSATEPGSPVIRTSSGRRFESQGRKKDIEHAQRICELLTGVFNVVELLESQFGKPSKHPAEAKRRKLELSTPVLKESPETAALFLESYFRLLHSLTQTLGSIEGAQSWSYSCLTIWRSCSYGVADFSKLASLVSTTLSLPIAMLLSLKPVSNDVRYLSSWFLGTYVFQPVSSSKSELLKALKPLTDSCSKKSETHSKSIKSSLPIVLDLAVEKADRDYSMKQRRQAGGFLSVLLSCMLSITDGETAIHCQLLDLAISHKVVVDEEALGASLDLALRKPGSIDWDLLRSIAEVDLDVIQSPRGKELFSKITNLKTHECDARLWAFVEQIIKGTVETRDLENFFDTWSTLLDSSLQSNPDNLWQSDKFQQLVSSHVDSGLTQNQILNVLTTVSSSGISNASLVIIDSILRGIHRIETIDKLEVSGFIELLLQKLEESIEKKDKSKTTWRQSRLLLRLIDRWPSLGKLDAISALKQKLLTRLKVVLERVPNLDGDTAKELSVLFALIFLLLERFLLERAPVQDVFGKLIPLFHGRPEHRIVAPWDGNFDQINDVKISIVSFAFTLVNRFLPVLSGFEDGLIQGFLNQFLVAASYVTESDDSLSLRSAWSTLVAGDSQLYENGNLKDNLFSALVSNMKSDALDPSQITPVLEALTNCPLSIVKKTQREAILDALFDILKKKAFQNQASRILPVMVRFTQLPANSSKLASTIGAPEGIFGFLFSPINESLPDLDLRLDLVTSIVKRLVESRHHEKAGIPLLSAIDLSISFFNQPAKLNFYSRAWCYSIIAGASGINSQEETEASQRLGLLKDKLLKALIHEINVPSTTVLNDKDLDRSAWDLQFLEALALLPQAKLSDRMGNLDTTFSLIVNNNNPVEKGSARARWLQSYGALACFITDDGGKRATATAIALNEKGQYDGISMEYKALISGIETTALCNLVEYVTDACLPEPKRTDMGYLTVLRDIVSISSNRAIAEPILEEKLSFVLSQLNQALTACDSFINVRILLETVNLILKQKGSSIPQVNIEEALASIATITSSVGPSFENPSNDTSDIFIPLCTLVGYILGNQRFRIKGRHGLVIAVLRSLMGLLFVPKAGQKQQHTEIYPLWLRQNRVWAVKKEAGVAYCRLLTMLCDPSTSSVRMNQRSDDLSSATMAARKAVEVYIPSLIRQFISLSLTHHLATDVKLSLAPGLYAMFDVMDESTLRSLNSSLGNPGRVLFKSLYDDWSKFGKWTD